MQEALLCTVRALARAVQHSHTVETGRSMHCCLVDFVVCSDSDDSVACAIFLL